MPRHDTLAMRDGAKIIKALEPVAPHRIANILPELETAWSERALQLQQRAQEATERGDHNAAQRWTWCAGVATDKVNALKGRPVEGPQLHLHRHEIGPVMDRLAAALRAPQPFVVERVAHSPIVDGKPIRVIEARVIQSDDALQHPSTPPK